MEKWIQLARQHMDHHAYGHAREALQNALVLRPKDPGVARLLKEIEIAEQEYLRLCREKEELYQAARNAWQNGEVSQALSRMRAVIDLEVTAPAASPDASSKYKSFYEQLRLEEEAINNGYAEARRHLADGRFGPALQICTDFLSRYPGQALFQALKFDIVEHRRQQLSRYIADVDDRLRTESDLDAKVSLLREAIREYPDEEHFRRLLTFFEEQRIHVKSILERVRLHEAAGRFAEALADLDTLKTIHGAHPGLAFEQERLLKRLEQQTRQAAHANWVRQIDQQLAAGNYTRAEELLGGALAEFPDDAELVQLRQLAFQGQERTRRADALVAEARQLCTQGSYERSIELLKIALQLDDRNSVRQALRDVLVVGAQESLGSDWRLVLSFSDQALEIDPNHALARSLHAQALDRKCDEEISQCVTKARRLQAAGDIAAALAEVRRGLGSFPADSRLTTIAETLQNERSRTIQTIPPPPAPTPAPAPVTGPVTPIPQPLNADPIVRADSDETVESSPSGRWKLSRPVLASAAAIAVVAAIVVWVRIGDESGDGVTAPIITPAPPATIAPEAAPAVLSLQRLPPGLQVSLDGEIIGGIGQTGAFSYPRITPGRHVLLFTMPEYEPFTIETEFIAGETLTLSDVDVPLTRLRSNVEFIANEGTTITVSQSGRPVERVNGSGKISIPEGTYDITAKGPAGVEAARRLRVTAGANRTVDVRGFVVTGMEQFDQAGWSQEAGWFRRRGGGVILYGQPTSSGRFDFTVGRSPSNLFSSRARLKWLMGYVDGGTYVRLELERGRLYRTDVVGGRTMTMTQIPHRIPDNAPFVYLRLQISGSRLMQQYSQDGQNWSLLDDWTRVPATGMPEPGRRTALDGRFGLVLQEDEAISLSSFAFYPDAEVAKR
jgi:tetratricopeptide (TPR) repeat protein